MTTSTIETAANLQTGGARYSIAGATGTAPSVDYEIHHDQDASNGFATFTKSDHSRRMENQPAAAPRGMDRPKALNQYKTLGEVALKPGMKAAALQLDGVRKLATLEARIGFARRPGNQVHRAALLPRTEPRPAPKSTAPATVVASVAHVPKPTEKMEKAKAEQNAIRTSHAHAPTRPQLDEAHRHHYWSRAAGFISALAPMPA